MKDTLLAITFPIFLLLTSINSFGQFGVKGGYIRSTYGPISDKMIKGYNGYSLGVFYAFKLNKILRFQVETNYAKKGFRVNEDRFRLTGRDTTPSANYIKITHTFIEVPLLLKAEFGKKIKPYMMTGFSPNFSTRFNSKYYFMSYSVIGAGGINFPVKNNFIFAEIRMSTDVGSGSSYKCLSLLAGFMF